ncbi:HAD-IB family hydrolase [uncultured Clostridium sp.]|uniref:HAD-IB family hydrolase n=1 Tax=uncultured Clostridium sp. TaxID=59620 RepID=UPI0025FE5AB0|nr:HAD-IB family hydrolase [uncultured Clostridium sp.]
MKKLAIFDIDYTITKKETLMELFKYTVKNKKTNIRFLPRAVYCGLMYLINVYDEKKVKETFLKFIDKIKEEDLSALVKNFYNDRLKNILYKDAVDMMKKLKNEGYDIYLISASPEFYVKEFYAIKEVDKIIGTKFKFDNGVFSRKMDGENCKGEEKVKRLKSYLKENNIAVNFKESYMFSDSLSDKPLLDLVGKPYLINYKKKYNSIKILNWK